MTNEIQSKRRQNKKKTNAKKAVNKTTCDCLIGWYVVVERNRSVPNGNENKMVELRVQDTQIQTHTLFTFTHTDTKKKMKPNQAKLN